MVSITHACCVDNQNLSKKRNNRKSVPEGVVLTNMCVPECKTKGCNEDIKKLHLCDSHYRQLLDYKVRIKLRGSTITNNDHRKWELLI
jgi:hypothetical protein